MEDRYYEAHSCYYMSARERRRVMRNKIKNICNILAFVSAFFVLGIMGSAELNKISLTEFCIYELIAIIVLFTSVDINMALSQRR